MPTTVPSLPPFSTPPTSSDPSNFDVRSDVTLTEIAAFPANMNAVSAAIQAVAAEASASATTAVSAAIGTVAASATTNDSLSATTGSKTFTVETGKAIVANAAMTFKKNSNAADTFSGTVTSYNASTGALTINATSATGSTAAATGWQGVITKATPDTGTLMVRNEQAQNTGPSEPNFAANAWFTRLLNTVVANTITGASLSGSQITLPAGTYEFFGQAPVNGPGGNAQTWHKTRLRNVTDATYAYGVGAFGFNAGVTIALLEGRFTIAAAKVFDLQHIMTSTSGTPSAGAITNVGGPEIYSTLTIRKVG